MMARSLIAVTAALVAAVEGQTTGTPTTTTSSSPVPTHTVVVGATGFQFTPNEITNASVGDIIEYRFYPGGHTVARADFGNPCIPYEDSGLVRQGFWSGKGISPNVITNDLPKYQVRVNDTYPIFFYCTAPGSCSEHHMLGVINPNATQTLDLQMQFALKDPLQLEPGEPFPSETLNPTHTASPSSTGSGAASNDDHDHHGLSAGAIAGIAIGGAAVLVLAGALVFLCGRRGGLDMAYRRNTQTFPPGPPAMIDNKYNPKSPGHDTFSSTNHYAHSIAVVNDPYRTNSPHAYSSSPPPVAHSPNSHPAYGTYSSNGGHTTVQSPLMAGMTDGSQGYYPGITPPPAEISAHPYPRPMQAAPAELATSADPGNSPLPGYKPPGRQYSWSHGQETQYRPGSKV